MNILSFKRDRPTTGVLTGWTSLGGTTPEHDRASSVSGIQSAAHTRQCQLLLSWGIRRIHKVDRLYPAWPEVSTESDFVPVGPWNTDDLIIFTPLGNQKRSVIMANIDHFKEYNDRFGHPAGDEALQHIAHCHINHHHETDVVARVGKEEFTTILPQTGINGAIKVAEEVFYEAKRRGVTGSAFMAIDTALSEISPYQSHRGLNICK